MTQDLNGNDNDSRIVVLDDARIKRADTARAEKPPSEPVLNMPPVTKMMSLLIIAVFCVMFFLPPLTADDFMYSFAFVPARYTGGQPFDLSAVVSPVTYMFMHAGWLHLCVNIGMLMAFGAALEKTIGGKRFLALYFMSGLVGALVHFAFYPYSLEPLVGASGAISGLFGAIVMWMYDTGQIGRGYRKLMPLILVWVGTSLLFGIFGMPGAGGTIAWIVHVGGFAAGLLLFRPVVLFKNKAP